MNFVFYDLETTGRNSTWDQIIQVGAILVDNNFKEIDHLIEYFNEFREDLSKKTLNFHLKSVNNQ